MTLTAIVFLLLVQAKKKNRALLEKNLESYLPAKYYFFVTQNKKEKKLCFNDNVSNDLASQKIGKDGSRFKKEDQKPFL